MLPAKQSAKVLTHSITEQGQEIVTFELELARYNLAEFNTHCQLSRNSSSSRAIPVDKAVKLIRTSPMFPIQYGKNISGMQSKGTLTPIKTKIAKLLWGLGMRSATIIALLLQRIGLHKQWTGRLIEPFQLQKIIVTATSYDNFFHLRIHEDAQPEIRQVAELMHKELCASTPILLKSFEWHLPYIKSSRNHYGTLEYYNSRGEELSVEVAKKVSVSCCAQVSYRLLKDSTEIAVKVYDKLATSKPVHASAFCHLASPMSDPKGYNVTDLQQGETHLDSLGYKWSGNFKGWIQHRQLIDGNVCNKYIPN